MTADTWFVLRARTAQAYGRPVANGFLVQLGSTAMRNGSPHKKRDREERDRLLRSGILVPYTNPELYRFDRDHICNSASQAGGIVKDGNCSGPQAWRDPKTNRTLRECLDGHA